MGEAPIVVVGGGITGLAAGFRILELRAGPEVVLIERDSRLGGKIRTESAGGTLIEGGPDSFLSIKPGGVGLARRLGLGQRLVGPLPVPRRSYVRRAGRLHELPEGVTGLIPTRLAPLLTSPLLSVTGRLRAGLDLVLPRRKDESEESIAGFVSRRFGREAYDWLVEPLLSGIYAGDGAALSLDATFPQLKALERGHGSVLRGMLQQPRPPTPRGPAFLTPEGGLVEMVEALERRLSGACLRRAVGVVSLRRASRGYDVRLENGESLEASGVIVATPAFEAARILQALDGELAAMLSALPSVSTATVSLAYPASAVSRRLDSYGYVRPRAEGGPIVACTTVSAKWPGRAPAGQALFRLFVGRAGMDDVVSLPDQDLLSLVKAELRETLGVSGEPSMVRIYRWPRGIPQYTLGHANRIAAIEHRLREHPRLQLAGASYHGIGIPDCIVSGEQAADRLRAGDRSPE